MKISHEKIYNIQITAEEAKDMETELISILNEHLDIDSYEMLEHLLTILRIRIRI